MLFISGEQLRHLMPMRLAIAAVRDAFIAASADQIEQPLRLAVGDGDALAMLARDRRTGGTVLKGVTIRPQNPRMDLPAVQAMTLWFDGPTGAPLAAIDGTTLTSLRTGAASGVATDLLAPSRARVLAVIGAGGQAADQIRAVCAVRDIDEVRVSARSYDSAERLARDLGPELGSIRIVPCHTVVQAIHEADIVCTATNARHPLFEANELSSVVHVNAIGAHTIDMSELPPGLLRSASVVAVDRVDAALAEAGDLIEAIRQGAIESTDLIEIGNLLSKRWTHQGGRTVFKSVGIAAQDLAIASAVVARFKSEADVSPYQSMISCVPPAQIGPLQEGGVR